MSGRSEEHLTFAERFVRLAKATMAPVSVDAALDELGDDHELTLTVAQFREMYEHASREADTYDDIIKAAKWARMCVPFPSDCHSALVAAIAKATGGEA